MGFIAFRCRLFTGSFCQFSSRSFARTYRTSDLSKMTRLFIGIAVVTSLSSLWSSLSACRNYFTALGCCALGLRLLLSPSLIGSGKYDFCHLHLYSAPHNLLLFLHTHVLLSLLLQILILGFSARLLGVEYRCCLSLFLSI